MDGQGPTALRGVFAQRHAGRRGSCPLRCCRAFKRSIVTCSHLGVPPDAYTPCSLPVTSIHMGMSRLKCEFRSIRRGPRMGCIGCCSSRLHGAGLPCVRSISVLHVASSNASGGAMHESTLLDCWKSVSASRQHEITVIRHGQLRAGLCGHDHMRDFQELSFDYQWEAHELRQATKCLCGTPSCRCVRR